jgi:hypothetical protein
MRVASEKYGTAIMKTEEVLTFVEAAVENGSDIQEAVDDMRMIDSLLYMKKLHLAVYGHIRRTSKGNLRKGSDLYSSLMSVIDGRIDNAF